MIWLALMAGMNCPTGQAATGLYHSGKPLCAFVPAENGEGCGPTAHRHAMNLDEHGHYVVNKQKGELDIVFDGECHDNDKEFVCTPEVTAKGVSTCVDSSRKVLPKAGSGRN